MPIYQYVPDDDDAACEQCRHGIEQLQKLSDPTLSACPTCGAAMHRVISAPAVISGAAHLNRESHIEKHGFTQYKRAGKGVYEKTAGKGPKFISGD